MVRLPVVSCADAVKAFERAGWHKGGAIMSL